MSDGKRQGSREILCDLFKCHPELEASRQSVEEAFRILVDCFSGNFKLLVCGNGGSAADSDHIVGELMKSFRFRRGVEDGFRREYCAIHGCPPPDYLEGALPAIALVSHTALSTAFANDACAEGAFAQQVYGYGQKGDVLLALSTSGNSENVVAAAKTARAQRMRVIGLTGSVPSFLSNQADVTIAVPETETYKVQELHLSVYHALCAAVEAELF